MTCQKEPVHVVVAEVEDHRHPDGQQYDLGIVDVIVGFEDVTALWEEGFSFSFAFAFAFAFALRTMRRYIECLLAFAFAQAFAQALAQAFTFAFSPMRRHIWCLLASAGGQALLAGLQGHACAVVAAPLVGEAVRVRLADRGGELQVRGAADDRQQRQSKPDKRPP